MNLLQISKTPLHYTDILAQAKNNGFTMSSAALVGSLLKTLVASKPAASFLELGTGAGLSLAWMLEGMDQSSDIVSIESDPILTSIAKKYLGSDTRATLICADGGLWIQENKQRKFALIFADTWTGKYEFLAETLDMLEVGGYYIVDDMTPLQSWTRSHAEKASNLVAYLDSRNDFHHTGLHWSTGIVLAVRTR